MDKLLGSEHVKANGIRFNAEKLRPVASETIRPFFLMVEEQDNFTPEDAAVLLGKDPFANIQARLNMAADRVFSMKPPALEKSDSKKTLEATPPAGSPLVSDTRFMITDISAEKVKM